MRSYILTGVRCSYLQPLCRDSDVRQGPFKHWIHSKFFLFYWKCDVTHTISILHSGSYDCMRRGRKGIIIMGEYNISFHFQFPLNLTSTNTKVENMLKANDI